MTYDSKTYGQSPFGNTDLSAAQTTTIGVPAVEMNDDGQDRSARTDRTSVRRRDSEVPNESLSGAYPQKSSSMGKEPRLPSDPPSIKLRTPRLSVFHCSNGVSGWPYLGEIVGWCIYWLAFGFIRSLASPKVVRYMSIVFSRYTLIAVVCVSGYAIARALTLLELRSKDAQAVANEALRLDTKDTDSLSNVSENANEALFTTRQSVDRTRKFVVSLFAFLVAYLIVSVLY